MIFIKSKSVHVVPKLIICHSRDCVALRDDHKMLVMALHDDDLALLEAEAHSYTPAGYLWKSSQPLKESASPDRKLRKAICLRLGLAFRLNMDYKGLEACTTGADVVATLHRTGSSRALPRHVRSFRRGEARIRSR